MQQLDFRHGDYHITSDKALLQPGVIHEWLSTKSYWSPGIPFEKVRVAFDNSFCVGALHNRAQIGFARFITDYTTFGYLADVYVIAAHRGNGLAKAMCGAILELDWVKNLRRIMLATKDAHAIYAAIGFSAPQYPDRLMEIVRPNPYQ